MKIAHASGWLGLSLFLAAAPASAEVVELKSGQKIEGQVLKETDRELFVDAGVEVIRIPLDRVLSRHDSAAEREPTQIQKNDVYTTARMPVKSVKELAE